METLHEEGIDTLSSLEQRIQRAVELLATLRDQNKELARQLAQTQSEREEAAETRNIVAQVEAHAGKLSEELDLLRDERKQVKSRIEKLLGQMDLLSAS
jgi:predicted nuclease with TOPRIM domain